MGCAPTPESDAAEGPIQHPPMSRALRPAHIASIATQQGEWQMGTAQMQFELRFQSFASEDRYAFPCDGCGLVDMDRMTDRERNDYLFARAVVGYQLKAPQVLARA